MKLEQNQTYRAQLTLGWGESLFGNETVAQKFREVGFANVAVTGSGSTRHATGTWPHATREVALPSQVVAVSRT